MILNTTLFILIILVLCISCLIYYTYYTYYISRKKTEKYDNNFITDSFFYYDRIEKDVNKSIVSINTKDRYAFYVINLSNDTNKEFSKSVIPPIVYYKDDASKELFLILCKIFNKETKDIIFEQNTINHAMDKKASMYLYLMPTTEFVQLQSRQKAIVYNYSNIDPKKLNVLLPYAALLHQNIKPSTEIYKLIHFDTCIYQKSKKYIDNNYTTDPLVVNFYNMLGYKLVQKKSVSFSDKDQVKIYYKDRVSFTIENNIPGKITNIKEDFVEFIVLESIDDILKAKTNIGDVIVLKGQTHNIENNTYYYLGDNKLATFFPLVAEVPYHVNPDGDILYNSNEIYYMYLNDRVYFTNIDKRCFISKKYSENDTFYLECSILSEKEDFSNYECVTNPNIKFKDQCESDYDLSGVKKSGFDVWDKRCKNHTDCPFFTLDNYKGKCNDNGYCEMPLGVTNIGYRKYLTGSDSNDCPYKDKMDQCIF